MAGAAAASIATCTSLNHASSTPPKNCCKHKQKDTERDRHRRKENETDTEIVKGRGTASLVQHATNNVAELLSCSPTTVEANLTHAAAPSISWAHYTYMQQHMPHLHAVPMPPLHAPSLHCACTTPTAQTYMLHGDVAQFHRACCVQAPPIHEVVRGIHQHRRHVQGG
jgi:hypothetical protein